MEFNYDIYHAHEPFGIIDLLTRAHSYTFKDIEEFLAKMDKLEPTPKTKIPLCEKSRMQGLAYLVFNHKLSFNYSGGGIANLSDLYGKDMDVLISPIMSHTNFAHGLSDSQEEELLADQPGKKVNQRTFTRTKCVYNPVAKKIALVNYTLFERSRLNTPWGGFNLRGPWKFG